MLNIKDSLEYQLSNLDKQDWIDRIFNKGVKFEHSFKAAGYNTNDPIILVKVSISGYDYLLNLQIDLDKSFSTYPVFTVPDYKYSKGKGGYILQRASKNKVGIVITEKQIRDLPDFKEFIEKIKIASEQELVIYTENYKRILYSYLPKIAQKAINEQLFSLLNKPGQYLSVRQWFTDNEFTNIPTDLFKLKNLNQYQHEIKNHSDYIGNTWQSGINIVIDWENKTFKQEYWNSSK